MVFRLPRISVGLGKRCGGLTAFPLYLGAESTLHYSLGLQQMKAGRVRVAEAGQHMIIDRVKVENRAGESVLFVEGDQIVGARQDRIVNTSVMVPHGNSLDLPVSCSEHGRSTGSQRFSAGDNPAPICLRRVVKGSVTQALIGDLGFVADQSGIWSHIKEHHRDANVVSPTQALADLYRTEAERVADFVDTISYPPGCAGVALAIGRRLVSLDLFDTHRTCRALWSRLVTSGVVDTLRTGAEIGDANTADVSRLLDRAASARWLGTAGVGRGDELRASSSELEASALVVDGTVVHFSAMPKN